MEVCMMRMEEVLKSIAISIHERNVMITLEPSDWAVEGILKRGGSKEATLSLTLTGVIMKRELHQKNAETLWIDPNSVCTGME